LKRHLKEPIIVYAIICSINYFFFIEDFMFISMKLHPFLFVTVLFAVRYGIWPGTFSGILGSGITLWAVLASNDSVQMELINGKIDTLTLPLAIIILGILIGEVVETRKKKTEHYQNALKREVDALIEKSKENKGLKLSILEIEKKLAGHGVGIHDFSSNLIKLFSMNKMEMYTQVHFLLKNFLNVNKAIILISNPDAYHLKGLDQDGEIVSDDLILDLQQNNLFQISQLDRKCVALTEKIETINERNLIKEQPYYCGPVEMGEEKIDAMVVVTGINFIDFNITNYRLFDIICKTASQARIRQDSFEKIRSISPYHEFYLVERSNYFIKHLGMLLEYLDEVDVIVTGFKFQDHVNQEMKKGFNMLLAQLCSRFGVRTGYIECIDSFAFYTENHSGEELKKELLEKYMNYGFSIGMAQIKICCITVKQEHVSREYEFIESLFEKNFNQTEVSTYLG